MRYEGISRVRKTPGPIPFGTCIWFNCSYQYLYYIFVAFLQTFHFEHQTVLSRIYGNHKNRLKQKQKYRGMFETQKSRYKTSSGDIGLNIRTLASPKVGQDQVSGGVSVLCWHAAPVANVLWKPLAIR